MDIWVILHKLFIQMHIWELVCLRHNYGHNLFGHLWQRNCRTKLWKFGYNRVFFPKSYGSVSEGNTGPVGNEGQFGSCVAFANIIID